MSDAPLVLVVNPGTGSTKIALFQGGTPVAEEALRHPPEAIRSPRMADQLPLRLGAVRDFLARSAAGRRLDAAVGRGGLLGPVPAGTLRATPEMAEELLRGPRGEHASNLGVPIALAVAREHGCPAFTVDPVSVDELEPEARITGLAGVERRSFAHALNIRAVARRHARAAGRPLAAMRLVVAHLGTGVSLAALRDGRMVDVVNPQDEGPFSGDRAGGVPVTAVVDACFAPGATRESLRRRLFGDGGLFSLLGTRDAREAVARGEAGDAAAALAVAAMCLQVAKSIGALATALEGRVDAVILTGGMAHDPRIVDPIRRRVEWIAPVAVLPGEDELGALAEGALRVLSGEEAAREYAPPPSGA
ncbi:MAG TPA: butyrate kinase [Anaeromyxobacteraceae bacterium]|nr:butyrate kinase [Anaeromyxobacteraceae bacterium]